MNILAARFVFILLMGIVCGTRSDSRLKQSITKLTDCKAQFDDGTLFDLTRLDNVKSPLKTASGDYYYLFNPCTGFKCSDVNKPMAACQEAIKGGAKYDLGTQASSAFSLDDSNNVVITYKNSASIKTTVLTCVCGKSQSFTFLKEYPQNTYDLKLTSSRCCPGGGDKDDSGGLSVGSVLVIIFFSLLAGYIIGGVIFMKFVRKAEGKQMIPNYEFWESVPGNVKGGFQFTISKIRGKNNEYSNF